jgi:hypothetical protein
VACYGNNFTGFAVPGQCPLVAVVEIRESKNMTRRKGRRMKEGRKNNRRRGRSGKWKKRSSTRQRRRRRIGKGSGRQRKEK